MKRFTPDDLKYINYLSSPDMHPGGRKTAFVKTVADDESGEFIPRVFELKYGGAGPSAVTEMSERSKRPLYSPDGKSLAYLSDKSGAYQIYIRREGAGRACQMTTLRHGVTYFDWSPDSSKLVFTAPLWADELGNELAFSEMTQEEKKAWLEEREWAPVEITEIDYKNDDCYGIRDGSLNRIGIVDADGGGQGLIPTEDMQCKFPAFSRDGNRIGFYGKPYKGVYASSAELFVYTAGDASPCQITKDRTLMLAPETRPLFSLTGERVYAAAYHADEDSGGFVETIYAVELNSGRAEPLFKNDSRTLNMGIHSMAVGRSVYGEENPYFAVDYNHSCLYFKTVWQGRERLYKTPLDGGTAELVYSGDKNVHEFCLPVNGRQMIIAGDHDTPGELYCISEGEPEPERLTFSNEWMKEYLWAKTEEVWMPTKDGRDRLQAWIVYPVSWEEGRKYPLVLDIHGGPECSYTSDFWHEFQAMAAEDMVCVYTNPRGSSGYGISFSGNQYAWAQEAVDDLLLAVQAAVDRGLADPERLGVTGGSYGGYMTLKLISQTNYFRAAAAQRSLANLATSYGTGDMGFISKDRDDVSKVKMLDVLTDRARRSLIRNVDQIHVPLLLLHGYKDYRCSFEQSEQMFIAMKERKPQTPVRLVMFPEDNHGITRTGKLYSQIRHLQELTDWFKRYLSQQNAQGREGDD